VKAAIAVAILAVTVLWPLAHRGLVEWLDVNPWKLFGFAMYTTPTPPVQVIVFRRGEGGLTPVDERALPQAIRAELARFRSERHALGLLRTPDGVARLLLQSLPDEAWIVIAVQRMKLDPATATMTSRREQYVYERGQEGSAAFMQD
jgi:hypothetical protein